MYRILIVEDDATIASQMKLYLEKWGYEVCASENFDSILGEFDAFNPHLVLMDIGLPFANGFFRCSEIRKKSKVPVIFLSSASDIINMVTAINMGGDDFISKPFDFTLLTAKIMALLRRAYELKDGDISSKKEFAGATYNNSNSTIVFNNKTIELTKNENRILTCLLDSKSSIVTRSSLMEHLWSNDCFVDENTLSVNVNRLRKKLTDAGMPDVIVTKKGQGYIIE